MLIDFHTHIFPDEIASKTVEILKENIVNTEGIIPIAYTDATKSGLLKSMEQYAVDKSIVLPIATNVRQSAKINDFAELVTDRERIISFGSVHPMQSDAESVLADLAGKGFLGIKLHPEYQQFFIDSEESLRILKKAEELKLLVVLHTGKDIGMNPPVHCPPQRLKNALSYVSGKNIIAGHLGGFRLWDDVEKYLIDTEIYFDTAFTADFIEPGQYKRIIENHGPEKILFGTDSPWESPEKTLNGLSNLGLSPETLDKIKYKNALRLIEEYTKL